MLENPETMYDLIHGSIQYLVDTNHYLRTSTFIDSKTKHHYIISTLDTTDTTSNIYWIDLTNNHSVEYWVENVDNVYDDPKTIIDDLVHKWDNLNQFIRQNDVLKELKIKY